MSIVVSGGLFTRRVKTESNMEKTNEIRIFTITANRIILAKLDYDVQILCVRQDINPVEYLGADILPFTYLSSEDPVSSISCSSCASVAAV